MNHEHLKYIFEELLDMHTAAPRKLLAFCDITQNQTLYFPSEDSKLTHFFKSALPSLTETMISAPLQYNY